MCPGPILGTADGMIGSRARGPGLAALVLGALAGGCGGAEDDAVRTVVEGFYAALDDGDAADACALLAAEARTELERSSGSPCVRALPEEVTSPRSGAVDVHRYGDAAKADVGAESVFLAHDDTGWRIIGAGCEPRSERPFECAVKGG